MKLVMHRYRSAIGKVKTSTAKNIQYYSSLTGLQVNTTMLGSSYWVRNLISSVKLAPALMKLCMRSNKHVVNRLVDIFVEIGPHAALQGPIKESLRAHAEVTKEIRYIPSLMRNQDTVLSAHRTACNLFESGYSIDLGAINTPLGHDKTPAVLTDLPTYQWKHERHWHESRLSRNFRLREFGRHDILGLRTTESADSEPSWRNVISLESLPWLQDHRIQSQVACPISYTLSMGD